MNSIAPISKGLCRQYRKILNCQLGKSTGSKVYEEFKISYSKLHLNREIYESKALNRHLARIILPGIALYEAFLSYSHTMQDALDLFGVFNRILYAKTAIAYKTVGTLPMFFGLLRMLSARSMSVTYPCDGWSTQWIENSSSRIDDELYENISRRVKWQGTKTLRRGGNTCDFRFITEEKKHEVK